MSRFNPMPLSDAISILVRAHLRDDELTGYVVERMPSPELRGVCPSDYIEAWGTLWASAGRAKYPFREVDFVEGQGIVTTMGIERIIPSTDVPVFSEAEVPYSEVLGGPLSLTDQHVAALERAIIAKGYSILVDPESGDVILTCGSCGAHPCRCEIAF